MADDGALRVVREGWELWVAGDLEKYLSLWADDGVWTMAGQSQVSGQWRGREEIAKMAGIAFEMSGGTLQARLIELAAASEESVLGYFHLTASRPGASIDQDGLQRLVVRDGKIVSLLNLFADVAEIDAFYK